MKKIYFLLFLASFIIDYSVQGMEPRPGLPCEPFTDSESPRVKKVEFATPHPVEQDRPHRKMQLSQAARRAAQEAAMQQDEEDRREQLRQHFAEPDETESIRENSVPPAQSARAAIERAMQLIAQQPVDERWERLRRLFTNAVTEAQQDQAEAPAPEAEDNRTKSNCCDCVMQ